MRKDGEAVWVSVDATVIRDEAGQPLRLDREARSTVGLSDARCLPTEVLPNYTSVLMNEPFAYEGKLSGRTILD